MKSQKTKLVILGLLTMQPLSGYDIKKFIEKSIDHFWSESNGQLYPALNQLVQEKHISRDQKNLTGKKVTHLYSITDQGRAKVAEWLKESTEEKNIHRDEELLKLFFGISTSKETSIELLKKREERVQEKLHHYNAIQAELLKRIDSPKYLYGLLTLKNGICHAEADLKWCRESIEALS